VATVATAVALSPVVVAVLRGADLVTPATWLAALFLARGLLALAAERVAASAGVAVS